MSVDQSVDGHLDDILTEIGEFGRYQKITCLLIFIVTAISEQSNVNYVITANSLDYR